MPKKKLYIAVKCGLIEDSKHREAIGNAIWVYLHILNLCNWESGKVLEWRDKDEAETLDMSQFTLRNQRQQLEKLGYITCLQKGNHLSIIVNNWTNPRSYSGEILNKTNSEQLPKTNPDKLPLESEGNQEGNSEGNQPVTRNSVTPTLNQMTDDREGEPLSLVKKITGKRSIPLELRESLCDTLTSHPDEERLRECWVAWIAHGYRRDNWAWALEWYKNGIPQNGKSGTQPAPQRGAVVTKEGEIYV